MRYISFEYTFLSMVPRQFETQTVYHDSFVLLGDQYFSKQFMPKNNQRSLK